LVEGSEFCIMETMVKTARSLDSELRRVAKVLIKRYKPEKIIVYGSLASGKAGEDSDLDLVVVKKTGKRFYDRIGEVLRLVEPREAMDVLVYTPEEYMRMKKDNWFIGEEVEKKGKVVYSA
jgi:predicted nucleotidyltransferase